MITILQILCTLLVLYLIFLTFRRLRQRKISKFSFAFWTLAWLSITMMVYIPDLVGPFSRLVHIKPIDLGVYLGLIAAYYTLFRLEMHIDKMNADIRLLAEIIHKREVEKNRNLFKRKTKKRNYEEEFQKRKDEEEEAKAEAAGAVPVKK